MAIFEKKSKMLLVYSETYNQSLADAYTLQASLDEVNGRTNKTKKSKTKKKRKGKKKKKEIPNFQEDVYFPQDRLAAVFSCC